MIDHQLNESSSNRTSIRPSERPPKQGTLQNPQKQGPKWPQTQGTQKGLPQGPQGPPVWAPKTLKKRSSSRKNRRKFVKNRENRWKSMKSWPQWTSQCTLRRSSSEKNDQHMVKSSSTHRHQPTKNIIRSTCMPTRRSESEKKILNSTEKNSRPQYRTPGTSQGTPDLDPKCGTHWGPNSGRQFGTPGRVCTRVHTHNTLTHTHYTTLQNYMNTTYPPNTHQLKSRPNDPKNIQKYTQKYTPKYTPKIRAQIWGVCACTPNRA